MSTVYNYNNMKRQLDFVQSHSLRELIAMVNKYNENNPANPILKEDVVEILKEEGTFILLYYK